MTSRAGGGSRDRSRRDYPGPPQEKPRGSSNPPSRHLWVGNLPQNIVESDLAHCFLRFGELDSVAFLPGRSYAFINFQGEEEAIAAMRALNGFPLAGNPLRVEFAKSDKSSTPVPGKDYMQRRDEQRSASRGSPFSQRDSRASYTAPGPFYPDKSKAGDRNGEPSEVLWIGFPSLLKVDEMSLRKAFSPFGEIEKITVFPGRTYAFVQFGNVISACRAKETLQGKLFGNPHVLICFARSETGPSNSGRGSMNVPLSPHLKSDSRPESSDNFRQDRNYGSSHGDPTIGSPNFISSLDRVDSDMYGFNRKEASWNSEQWRPGDVRFEQGLAQDMYDRHGSPTRERDASFHDFPHKFPQNSFSYEDQPDLPEDTDYFHGAKKLKTGTFPPDRELPEYPSSEQEKHSFPRAFSDFPHRETFDKNIDARSLGYKQMPDHPALPHGDRNDLWNAPYESFQAGSGSLLSNPVDRKRIIPESDRTSLMEWKWEGTIAKGGSSVCRARCFPVGTVMDIMLPEFLDCTARTGLDVLAKHYYQAASAWVVFFVPHSDADIGLYNEFMHYLGEKQRAAVAKLDDKTTLFLVPPSEFSEKVLKVPGKLSISGVVLRLEHPGSSSAPVHHPNEKMDRNLLPFHVETSFPNLSTPARLFPSMTSVPDSGKLGSGLSFVGNMDTSTPPASFSGPAHGVGHLSDSYGENRHDYQVHQRSSALGPNWSPHHMQNTNSSTGNVPSQGSNTYIENGQEHHSIMPRLAQETSSTHLAGGTSTQLFGNGKSSHQETSPSVPLSMPGGALQPEQIAQLASSLLGQQRQLGSNYNVPTGDDSRQTHTAYGMQNDQGASDPSTSQFAQVQQLQHWQASNVPAAMAPTVQREIQPTVQGNSQLQSTGSQEAEEDPQKRLQATLQLAAALLQQIQQGKGSSS
ncbi:flowering time control protein FPA [Tripterygium wilfordii]|uniref:Flowering time control protein FPA n=1 Tax=Tripterygium wilfordii TaxID=458696 RepID=A0A7J7D500_TRIWF|nr:flowering time control protein FPA [Tripterygium wilfordii]KAF5741349.1 flowering time control protein FPA [Tripterygium wilfordii]